MKPQPGLADPQDPDPRRWITLAVIITAVVIAALDSTVLNVAIPTILEDFDTTLSSLQWVITGYSLTFAALLIIGGRLADIFGARRLFIIGAALFGIGSLIASLSHGVVQLVIGEAIIEGAGASLMLPATMGILSSTFTGRERATAFGAWGATLGAAVAFGPLIGGFLTTNYSWRWAFRINVIIVPFAIAGALLFMRRVPPKGARERIDVAGAALIASGMFFLVFSISEGTTYGWLRPQKSLELGGATVWSDARAVSIVPLTVLLAIGLLVAFYRVERARERAGTHPLFEFSELRRPTFGYGLATLFLLAMGQIAFLLVLSVFLQETQHLSAIETGTWLVPPGLFIVVGSQVGSRLTERIGTTEVVRIGLALEALGMAALAVAVGPSVTFWRLIPGFALFGLGIGFAASQLTNVVLSGVAPERSGAASGANTTVRMIGSSLGIAVVSALLVHGPRPPLLYATAITAIGVAVSFLIPPIGVPGDEPARSEPATDELAREADCLAETANLP